MLPLDLLVAAGSRVGRTFSTVPYVGTGVIHGLATEVPSQFGGAMAIVSPAPPQALSEIALYDTVRGAALRGRFTANEDGVSAIAFSNKDRILTGSQYNTSGQNWVLWNFERKAKFFDVVPFSGTLAGASVLHALGESPAAIVTLQRTGARDSLAVNCAWVPGDNRFISAGGILRASVPFSSVGATSVFAAGDPIFSSGRTFLALFFGTGSGRIVVGSFTPSASPHNETLPFSPTLAMVWRLPTLNGSASEFGLADMVAGSPGTVFPFISSPLPAFSVSGTTLTVNPATVGHLYRYLLIR